MTSRGMQGHHPFSKLFQGLPSSQPPLTHVPGLQAGKGEQV